MVCGNYEFCFMNFVKFCTNVVIFCNHLVLLHKGGIFLCGVVLLLLNIVCIMSLETIYCILKMHLSAIEIHITYIGKQRIEIVLNCVKV